jgi:two-component system, OmpR family, response regulator VanR
VRVLIVEDDIAVLDRDIPGPSGDEIATRIVASGSGMPILMLTAADRLDDKTTGFGLGTRKQFAVHEVLVAAEGGVISAEELLKRPWDQNADPFTNAVRITVSALRKRLGEPSIIATVAGAGYRIDTQPGTGPEGGHGG